MGIDAKKLLLLKISAVLIFVFLAVALTMTYLRMTKTEEEIKLGVIRNNETPLVAYGDEFFFFLCDLEDDKPNFKFVNKNEKASTTKIIKEYANLYVDSDILAKENKLYYYAGGDTYVYDITTGQISRFAQGQMQDLTDEWYVTLYDGTLYKGIYYHNTLNTKSIYPLTSDGTVQYAYEDDSTLYYIARTSKNYYALIGLNKSDLALTVYDTVFGYEENILKVASNKDYLFALIEYTNDSTSYALRIIPKEDKDNLWDVKLARKESADSNEYYSYELINREDVAEKKAYDKNIYMLRFKTNESGEKLQDGYMIYDFELEKTKIEKPTLTETWEYEYSAEIVGAQLIIYKNDKEYKKVTLSGEKEGEVKITNIYKIDDDMYYKILIDQIQRRSIYVRVNSEGNAEIYQ